MMNNPTHQTSTYPTAPAIISTAPRVNQRTTRANNPSMLPPFSRVITPPTSRATTPPTGPAETKPHTPDWYESPRGNRERTRVRKAQKEKRKNKTQAAINELVQASPVREKTQAKLGQMGTLQQPALIEDETEQIPYPPLPKFQSSRMILQEALTAFTAVVWGMSTEYFIPQSMRRDEQRINTAIKLEHFCAPVVHSVSGETILKYQT